MKYSFCSREYSDVPCLVAGPAGNSICSDCAEIISEGISSNKKELNESVDCTFCGATDWQPHGIGVEGKAKICPQCVIIALEAIKNAAQTSN